MPGIGKSHALRYTVARLWHQRLHENGEFRILYIPEWHKANIASLRDELMLCFHDDLDIRQHITRLTERRQITDLLSYYAGKLKQRLVIVLDQAFDQASNERFARPSDCFPMTSRSIRVVFASSPRFELQGIFLAGDPREAHPLPFMDRLTTVECASMAVKLLCDMRAAIPPEARVCELMQGKARFLSRCFFFRSWRTTLT